MIVLYGLHSCFGGATVCLEHGSELCDQFEPRRHQDGLTETSSGEVPYQALAYASQKNTFGVCGAKCLHLVRKNSDGSIILILSKRG